MKSGKGHSVKHMHHFQRNTAGAAGVKSAAKWGRSERFERIGNFDLNGRPDAIFPLFCPVLEYEWLPDWNCTMYYSDSGVAGKDTVFHTKENLGKKVVWTNITYEPNSFIEYLMVTGTDAVIRLSITLEETGGETTHVMWRMLFTATSSLASKILLNSFSEEYFQAMMEKRERELNHYLATGKQIYN